MTPPPARSCSRRFRLPLALFAGAILMFQLAWLIGVPPYNQMDEIDHAYRAASVAHGHVTSNQTALPDARGYAIRVPATMVTAAHAACAGLKYLKAGNCAPLSAPNSDGDVLVASGASNYNPVYYAVVGVPAVYLARHSGTAMLLIMRTVTMAWCDLLLGTAILLTARVAKSIWPTMGVMITAMPVLLCASAAAAPNGVQMAAGLLMWAAMCGLIFAESVSARQVRWLLGFWTLGSCCVLLTHSTGPLWLAISFAIGVALLGKSRAVALYRSHRRAALSSLLAVVAAGAFSVFWTLLESTNLPAGSTAGGPTAPLTDYFQLPFVWLVQCIGAVPFRNQFAPPLVYVLGIAIILAFLVAAMRQRYLAGRWALSMIILTALAISLVLNAITYSTLGNAWQGRYTLALTYGVPVLAAWIIGTRSSAQHHRGAAERVLTTSIGVAMGLINAITLINIWNKVEHPWWPKNTDFAAPPTWLITTLACLGAVLMVAATERLSQRGTEQLVERRGPLNKVGDNVLP